MREIIFKGLSEKDNQWVYGDLVRIGKEIYIGTKELKNIKVKFDSVCQALDIFDDDGKRLWENDVMTHTRIGEYGHMGTELGFASLVNLTWVFKTSSNNFGGVPLNSLSNFKIIGNLSDDSYIIQKLKRKCA